MIKNRLMRSALVIACLLGFAAAAQAQSNGQWNALDSYIQTAMHDGKVPGLAVGIVQNGNAVYVKGFGVRDITTGQPVTPDTLFDIGSCTKAFTAAAVGILVDEGKMHWDDRVDEYIPFFHLYDPLADENVTMRDLLTHRTGMGGTDLLWYGSSFSPEEIIRRVRYIEPEFGFRAKFEYQNVMYATAGYAVGQASGGTWQDFVRAHIFGPLGMSGADFSATDAQNAADHATPHDLKDGKVVTIPWRNIDSVAPAGSINAGVKDMTKWIAMQLNDGMANGQQIVSAKSMREMHTPQIVVPQGGEFDLFFPKSLQLSYGMGWFIEDYGGHQIWLHPGDIDGFASLVVLIPEVKTGFVILTNLDHTALRSGLGYHLIDEFLNLPQQDWTAHFAKVAEQFSAMKKQEDEAAEVPKHADTHPSRELAAYAGTYRNKAYGDAVVSLEGDALQIQFHSFSGALKHFQYDTFVGDLGGSGNASVMFNLDENGDVSKLTMDGIEFARVGARVPR
ncbi:MAG: serine hydrolase [Candidatus Acidiferrales bacterium]